MSAWVLALVVLKAWVRDWGECEASAAVLLEAAFFAAAGAVAARTDQV